MNTSLASGPRSFTVEPTENRLLGALPAADLQRWLPHLEPVSLTAGNALSKGRDHAGHAVFPTTASISLMHTTREGDSLEVVAIGNEGMVGLQALMGGASALDAAVVRVGGQGLRVSKGWLQSEFHGSAAVMSLLLRYTQTLMTHTAQSAVCNTHHSLDQRLCRCLLSTLDRGHGTTMNFTHESLAYMLGVRREGVTGVAVKLQRSGLIHYARGRVAVLDRAALEERSCECYRVVKNEYDRLLPASATFTGLPPRTHAAPMSAPWAPMAHLAGQHRHAESGAMAR